MTQYKIGVNKSIYCRWTPDEEWHQLMWVKESEVEGYFASHMICASVPFVKKAIQSSE